MAYLMHNFLFPAMREVRAYHTSTSTSTSTTSSSSSSSSLIYITTNAAQPPPPPSPPDHVITSQPLPRVDCCFFQHCDHHRHHHDYRILASSSSPPPLTMANDSGWLQWALILVLTALLLSVAVLAQTASTYWAAYAAAPREMATFIDTVDFSIQENESYDKDMAKVQRLEDKLRLAQLLREIQRAGDDLREELNALLIAAEHVTGAGTGSAMRTSTRLLWAAKRTRLEDRVRRLDLLRMRFLVVFLGIITSVADRQPPPPPPLPRDMEKSPAAFATPPSKPVLRKSLTETIPKRPPVRRLTMQAIGHRESVASNGRQGWAGVVEELQLSPRMQQRHASIERSMSVERSLSPRERAP
ncbi:hypothetical protein MY11210_005140 [Beauveria gryllotalpidicola]